MCCPNCILEIGNSHQLYNKVNSYHFHLIHIYIKYIIMWCFYAKYLCFWGKRTYIIWKCGFDLSILKYLYFPFIILLHLYSRNTALCVNKNCATTGFEPVKRSHHIEKWRFVSNANAWSYWWWLDFLYVTYYHELPILCSLEQN